MAYHAITRGRLPSGSYVGFRRTPLLRCLNIRFNAERSCLQAYQTFSSSPFSRGDNEAFTRLTVAGERDDDDRKNLFPSGGRKFAQFRWPKKFSLEEEESEEFQIMPSESLGAHGKRIYCSIECL